jgi:hypothetical protein
VGNHLRKDRGGHGPFVGSPETGSAAPVSHAVAQTTEHLPFLEIRGKFISHSRTEVIFELTLRNLAKEVAVSPGLRFEHSTSTYALPSLMEGQTAVQRIKWANDAGVTLTLNWWLEYFTRRGDKLKDKGVITTGYYPHLVEDQYKFKCEQTSRYR